MVVTVYFPGVTLSYLLDLFYSSKLPFPPQRFFLPIFSKFFFLCLFNSSARTFRGNPNPSFGASSDVPFWDTVICLVCMRFVDFQRPSLGCKFYQGSCVVFCLLLLSYLEPLNILSTHQPIQVGTCNGLNRVMQSAYVEAIIPQYLWVWLCLEIRSLKK